MTSLRFIHKSNNYIITDISNIYKIIEEYKYKKELIVYCLYPPYLNINKIVDKIKMFETENYIKFNK